MAEAAQAATPAAPPAPVMPDADVVLDQVLAEFGDAPGGEGSAPETPPPTSDGGAGPAADPPPADAPPADKTPPPAAAKPETPPADAEGARLRKGFAKLAQDQEKLVRQQNEARQAIAEASTFRDKATAYDQAVTALKDPNADPAAWLRTVGGDELVDRVLQGVIASEQSPAEREVKAIRREMQEREARDAQQRQQAAVEQWRGGIVKAVADAGERFDLINTLGLHGQVIDVITGYYEKHSERDGRGNVTVPAILPWEQAAEAVENTRAEAIEKNSKRWGKRAAAPAPAPAAAQKAAPPSNGTPAPKRTGTPTLSSVPVAETPPPGEDGLSMDPEQRFAQVMAELNLA